METWKQLVEFPNYSISTLGNIMNNVSKKLLTPMHKKGKSHIKLTNRYSRRQTVLVAALVYEAYSGKYVGTTSVLKYLNGNPYDCAYTNINVISRSENMKLMKEAKTETFTIDEIFSKMQTCDGFITDIAQFSGGSLSMIENKDTERYFKDGSVWKKV